MTKEERDRLAELAAMAWGALRHEKDYSVFYGTDFKGIRAVWVSDGLVMVKGKELADAVDDWNNQKPSYKEVGIWLHNKYTEAKKDYPNKNPKIEFEVPTDYETYCYQLKWAGPITFDLTRKERSIINKILGFLAGVLLTALFNWIF